jgi:hypothetical protein
VPREQRSKVRLSFHLFGSPGWVDAAVEPNTDPEALGCPPFARDLPVCTAAVKYKGMGYHAALGWVQLVRSTDNASGGGAFEMDPFEPLGSLPHPYCFFGFRPVLFDAPARVSREDMDWVAESFLCFIHADTDNRETRAILGFTWGFGIKERVVSLRRPARLDSRAWDGHLPLLRAAHPGWAFAAGYRDR